MPNMTGRPGYWTMEMNGGSSVPYLALYPLRSLVCTSFKKGGSRRAFRLPGAGGDHFHCTVEPSPGHILCRLWALWARRAQMTPVAGKRDRAHHATWGGGPSKRQAKAQKLNTCSLARWLVAAHGVGASKVSVGQTRQ